MLSLRYLFNEIKKILYKPKLIANINSQTLTSGDATKVQFANVKNKIGITFNSPYEDIQIPKDGFYLVTYSIAFDGNSSGTRTTYIVKNDSAIYAYSKEHDMSGILNTMFMANSAILYLEKGDYINIVAYQNTGGDLALSSLHSYTAVQVSQLL